MTSAKKIINVNARFMTRPPTGVDRVAIELVSAIACLDGIEKVNLICPKRSRIDVNWIYDLEYSIQSKINLIPTGRLTGHLWEQIELPFSCRNREVLLSLCSTGPILYRNQLVMMHDTQVWDTPESYNRAFRIWYKCLQPILGRTSKYIATVSQFSAKRLAEVSIASKGKISVVPNGSDHCLRIPPDLKTLDKHKLSPGAYFFAIGSLAPHKNLKIILEAARKRSISDPEIIVAGGMNHKVFSKTLSAEVPGVRFLGRVSDSELHALYKNAIALLFPSITEGFGLPPIEAMTLSCPVIATTGGAVPEVCKDAVLYADPYDADAWLSAMEAIKADPELRNKLIKRGHKVSEGYSWHNAANHIMQILHQ